MSLRTVYGNAFSENGWPMVDQGSCVWLRVPGCNVTLEVREGEPQKILGAFAADVNSYAQPVRDGDSAGWTDGNSVATSNHLSGTAVDLDWNDHPMGPEYAGWSQAQIATLREILDFYEGMVFWGEDWENQHDSMHFQMGYNTYGAENFQRVEDFIARKIRADGFSTFRRDVPAPPPAPPPPPPAPTPDPLAAAIKALYDAVPVIDMARATQLVQPVMAGLALAQCNTPQRIAMWLAQIGEESGGFVYTEEIAKNGPYAPYIGRTWIQITWQSNYSAFGRWAAAEGFIDDPQFFVNNPAALADQKWAGIGAAWYWTVARPTINSLCDQGDVVGVTQLINGGQNGIADRRARYQQAIALGDELLALITPAIPPTPEGPLMALTDDEQHELLTKTREIWDQLRGPGGNGWPQLGLAVDGNGLTPVDALASMKVTVEGLAAKKATP